MATFKRFDGFTGSIPQGFIDNQLPKCPMCGTTDPYWTLSEKIGFVNRYLFKCDKCGCILSASVPDVTGFGRTALTNFGLAKMLSGKKVSTIYVKVEEVGKAQVTQKYSGQEFDLKDLKKMAEEI